MTDNKAARRLRILIIVNGAQEHRPFYSKVGAELLARGHDVQYCLDSHYTDYLHPEAELDPARTHYFSDYFRAHRERHTLPDELKDLNVWTMAFPDIDRMMYTRFGRGAGDSEFFESLLANMGHFFIELFDRFAFDAVVYENVSNTISYFAYEVAARRNARYVGFVQSRMPGRLDVVDYRFARDTQLATTFEAFRNGTRHINTEIRTFVDDYLANFDQKAPDYVLRPHPFHMSFVERYARARSLERFLRSVAYRLRAPDDLQYAQLADPLFVFPEQFAKEAFKHLKRRYLDVRIYNEAPDLSARYFVYPLQFHPESSTSVDGPAFPDEWTNVTGIARNLPLGTKLYVKDHKHAAGREPVAFYERIAKIPNVVVVHPDFNAKVLIRSACAVVVATTTMGFEAVILGKPVYVLGHPFYDFFPSCVRVDSFEQAFEQFRRCDSIRTSRWDIEALVAAYYLCSNKGMLDVLTQYEDLDVVRWIAGVIEDKASEHCRTHRGAPVVDTERTA